MSLNDIDRLVKSAFRTEEYSYKNKYWKDLESKLGPSKSGSPFGKILGALAVIIAGFSISTDQLNITPTVTSSQNTTELRAFKDGSKSTVLLDLNTASISTELQSDIQSTNGNNTVTNKSSSALSIIRFKNELTESSIRTSNSSVKETANISALVSLENESTQTIYSEEVLFDKSSQTTENVALTRFPKMKNLIGHWQMKLSLEEK